MIKMIIRLLKKIIFSVFLLYGYNILIQPLGFIIPINFLTVGIITMLGIPAMLSLIFIIIFIY